MAGVQQDQIVDLITTTQKHLGKMKFTNIAQQLQEYTVLPRLLKNNRTTFSSGTGIQRNIMVQHGNNSRTTRLFEDDTVNIGDVMKTMSVPWRHITTHYAFEDREVLMNTGAEQIVDLVKTRRIDAMLAQAELFETIFWGKPATSADDVTPFGIDYWVTYNATTGFNGGNPAGFADGPGGLSATTYPNWRNWTAQYTAVTKADLIKKMREAYVKTAFVSPVGGIPEYRMGTDTCVIYVNYETLSKLEEIGESQNENLGRDIASMDGTMVFRKCQIQWVPKLDAKTAAAPVYMLNWGVLGAVGLKGEWLNEQAPRTAPNKHRTKVVHVDTTFNLLCDNRRRQALIAKADPAA